MPTLSEESLELHRRTHGKLEIVSRVPLENTHDMSLAYTPGVAEVCRVIAAHPDTTAQYTLKGNTIAIISDGSAVLGLGNIGALGAIPVMEGKAILFKRFADLDAFPICLATQNTEEIIQAVKAIAPVFGGINLEDIAAPRCFEIEKRLIEELDIPVMHDDQHGTAVVVLAGLINALRVAEKSVETVRVVISGAGAAGTAIAELLITYGFKKIVVCDSHGAIYTGRDNLNSPKQALARITNPGCVTGEAALDCITGGLADALVGADVFIGVSIAGALTGAMISRMAQRPIIFAMANPLPEIMPDEARAAGAFIIATGRSDFPNQINNVLAFPGIFRGALDNHVRKITEIMLVNAAKNLAACVLDPHPELIIPPAFDPSVAPAVARAISA